MDEIEPRFPLRRFSTRAGLGARLVSSDGARTGSGGEGPFSSASATAFAMIFSSPEGITEGGAGVALP